MLKKDGPDYLFSKINYINEKGSSEINRVDLAFNEIKNDFYELTQKYEKNKIEEKIELENMNKIDFLALEESYRNIIISEHNNNINYINSILNKYSNKNNLYFLNDKEQFNKNLESYKEQIKETFLEYNEKLINLENERKDSMNNVSNENENEINNIKQLIEDINNELKISNYDKATSIQKIIKKYLEDFKKLRKNSVNFEEKITKLLIELLDKLYILKKK